MATSKETPARILDAAMRTIARRGPQRLSMSDVCDTAGISRGTLYRYFKSKDELLEGLGRYVQDELNAALDAAVERDPDPAHRLRVVTEALVRHRERHPVVSMVTEAEPGFALPFIRDSFPMFVNRVVELLGHTLDSLPTIQSGAAEPYDVAALLLRTSTSVVFIPEADAARLVDTIVAVVGGGRSPLLPLLLQPPTSRPEIAEPERAAPASRARSTRAKTSAKVTGPAVSR